jgi:hypothetical protein
VGDLAFFASLPLQAHDKTLFNFLFDGLRAITFIDMMSAEKWPRNERPCHAAARCQGCPDMRFLRNLPLLGKVPKLHKTGTDRLQAQGRVDFALFNIRASLNP